MISHTHKFIFIHIPKVAGTSLKRILTVPEVANKAGQVFSPFEFDEKKFDPPPPHLRPHDYLKYGYISKDLFDTYFKFSFVRNPWSRIVSEYQYRHSYKYSFKDFLFKKFPRPSWSDSYCHVIPQYDFLYDNNGNLIVDFVGKYENLKEDFSYICNNLGIEYKNLPHEKKSSIILKRNEINYMELCRFVRYFYRINKNTFRNYKDYYDDESIEHVARLYEKDVETFGYKF